MTLTEYKARLYKLALNCKQSYDKCMKEGDKALAMEYANMTLAYKHAMDLSQDINTLI